MLTIDGNLTIDAPGGGTLRLTNNTSGDFVVACSDGAAAREAFASLRAVYRPASRLRFLGGLRNPLAQEIELAIGDKTVLRWPAGKRLRVVSLSGLIRFLRGR